MKRRVIPDPSTAVAASQAGEVDVIEQPALDLLPLVRRTPNIRVQALTGLEEDREPQQRTDRHKTFDGTGRHKARGRLRVPGNVSLLRLPPCSPELNPVENIWDCLRDNKPGNSVFDTYDTIVDRCCAAWNWFTETPDRIRSVAGAPWTRTVKA